MKENIDITNKVDGRVEPRIYAFETCSVPNFLKIGDTYRSVYQRLDEWRHHYRNLHQLLDESAVIEDRYFRDYAVHSYVEEEKKRSRIQPSDFAPGLYHSNEFFHDATTDDVYEALEAIKTDYMEKTGHYSFYSMENVPLSERRRPEREVEPVTLRDNQKEVVDNFKRAISKKRNKLLMFAVMRFGKSLTAMSCAEVMPDCKLVVIVSAKADVKDSWCDTVCRIKNFEDFEYADGDSFRENPNYISDKLADGKKVAVCLTLQDISTHQIKDRYKELFNNHSIDLLIVDETHFGARAEIYGKVLQYNHDDKDNKQEYDENDETLEKLSETVHALKCRVQLHLSGTPYRILMNNEFSDEDIICKCTYPDIMEASRKWDEEHLEKEKGNGKFYEEWDNPYYGFPQMVRFAFHFNESSLKKLEELRKQGKDYMFDALFEANKDADGNYRFINEQEVLDFLSAINSGDSDGNILSFLNNDRIKRGELCHHIVMVLPRRAACDAMALLIKNHPELKPLSDYVVLQASGCKNVKAPSTIKRTISHCEQNGEHTITLTVGKMLTGTTVPEWDTMFFLRGSSSPQEYDQAIYRLQNQFVRKYKDKDGNEIRYNMKPQTLLVDFSPERLFKLQEQRAFVSSVISKGQGNEDVERQIERELSISPILCLNSHKLMEVEPVDIIDLVRKYSQSRSILDEAREIGTDYTLKDDADLYAGIMRYAAIDAKSIMTKAHNADDDTDANVPEGDESGKTTENPVTESKDKNEEKDKDSYEKRLATFFSHILFFAYLTKDTVRTLVDICSFAETSDNKRILTNLELDLSILRKLTIKISPNIRRMLEFKIANVNELSHDDSLESTEKVENAMRQFGRWSESEIITPTNIADDMMALIPADKVDDNFKFLDIASKEGEFANAIYKRFGDKVKNNIYSLPTSGIAYEFTRKVYEELDLPVKNIISKFTSYDLIGKNKEQHIETLKKMKFNAIVGNPPYQIGINKEPVYNLIIDISMISSGFGILIHPGRFLFNRGKTPKPWNYKMLHNEHYNVVKYWENSDSVFSSVDIKGGLAISMWDDGKKIGPIGTFVTHTELNDIKKKVSTFNEESISQLVYTRDLYQLTNKIYEDYPEFEGRQSKGHRLDVGTTIFHIFPEVFFEKKPENDTSCLMIGREDDERVAKWIKSDYLRLPDNFEYYKVLVPKSNGSGTFGETLSNPFVAKPYEGHNTTFLSIGKFNTEFEANACLRYIKTKFARCLLGILKVTQDNPRSVWNEIPIQDFSETNESIDWSLPIKDIDNILYAKYQLSKSEIEFIESNVKSME